MAPNSALRVVYRGQKLPENHHPVPVVKADITVITSQRESFVKSDNVGVVRFSMIMVLLKLTAPCIGPDAAVFPRAPRLSS